MGDVLFAQAWTLPWWEQLTQNASRNTEMLANNMKINGKQIPSPFAVSSPVLYLFNCDKNSGGRWRLREGETRCKGQVHFPLSTGNKQIDYAI